MGVFDLLNEKQSEKLNHVYKSKQAQQFCLQQVKRPNSWQQRKTERKIFNHYCKKIGCKILCYCPWTPSWRLLLLSYCCCWCWKDKREEVITSNYLKYRFKFWKKIICSLDKYILHFWANTLLPLAKDKKDGTWASLRW